VVRGSDGKTENTTFRETKEVFGHSTLDITFLPARCNNTEGLIQRKGTDKGIRERLTSIN